MKFKEFAKYINRKMKSADRKAKNPFLEKSFAYNPFMSAIEQTYIWVERTQKRR